MTSLTFFLLQLLDRRSLSRECRPPASWAWFKRWICSVYTHVQCVFDSTRFQIPHTSYSALCSTLFSRHGNDPFVRCSASVILHCCCGDMKCAATVFHGSRLKPLQQQQPAKDSPLLILVVCASSGRTFIFASPILCAP
jgi:hypothetical protein